MRKSILHALAGACAARAVFNLGQDVIGGFVGNGRLLASNGDR